MTKVSNPQIEGSQATDTGVRECVSLLGILKHSTDIPSFLGKNGRGVALYHPAGVCRWHFSNLGPATGHREMQTATLPEAGIKRQES